MNIQHRPIAKSQQKIRTYTELRQQIHDDLRIQHPDWLQSNGESPICDSYEARLMELLADLEEVRVPNPHAVAVYEDEQHPSRAKKLEILQSPQGNS